MVRSRSIICTDNPPTVRRLPPHRSHGLASLFLLGKSPGRWRRRPSAVPSTLPWPSLCCSRSGPRRSLLIFFYEGSLLLDLVWVPFSPFPWKCTELYCHHITRCLSALCMSRCMQNRKQNQKHVFLWVIKITWLGQARPRIDDRIISPLIQWNDIFQLQIWSTTVININFWSMNHVCASSDLGRPGMTWSWLMWKSPYRLLYTTCPCSTRNEL